MHKTFKAIKVLKNNQSIVLTSARDGSVVKDGEIIIGTRVALLQVEGHPGELDYVTWI